MAGKKKGKKKSASMVGKCKTVRRCGHTYQYCFGKKGLKKGFPKRKGR